MEEKPLNQEEIYDETAPGADEQPENGKDAPEREEKADESVKDSSRAEEPETEDEKSGSDQSGEDAGDDIMDGEWQEMNPEDGQPEGGEQQGLFRRRDKKDKKDQQIEELTDRVRRQMAEFDNFRKRTEKEKSAMYEVGAKSVIEKLLPVVDSFERGLSAAKDQEEDRKSVV